MYVQVVDCRTKKETVSCENCIVRENCQLQLELEDKKKLVEADELSPGLLVPLLLVRV